MVIWVVKFTHQPVDIRRGVSPNVWDEERDELWWHVVKDRTVHVHLWEDLTCDTQSVEKIAGENPQHSAGEKQSGWFSRITFSEWKNFLWRDKLVKSVFFIWELNCKEKKRVFCPFALPKNMHKCVRCTNIQTCGESLNMGVQTISGVEWCLAARARVWVPLTARSPPLAKTVCVPMMTCRETHQTDCAVTLPWVDETFSRVKYLVYTRHDCKNGSIRNHGCLNVSFGEAGRHLVSLRREKKGKSVIKISCLINNLSCVQHNTDQFSRLESTRRRPHRLLLNQTATFLSVRFLSVIFFNILLFWQLFWAIQIHNNN